jgi:uncharacterized protein (TIGR02611 family)
MDGEPRPRPKLIERLEARREEHLRRGRLYRCGFAVAGSLVLLAGVVMLVTPGPAFVLIPIGLAMLALEFTWAERMLDKSLEQAQIARERAAQTSRAQRVLGTLAGLCALGAAIAVQLKWDVLPFLPFP